MAGYSALQLKTAGWPAQMLVEAGFSRRVINALGYSLERLRDAGYTWPELKDLDFPLADVMRGPFGWSADKALEMGASVAELRMAGIPADRLFSVPLSALREAGYTVKEVMTLTRGDVGDVLNLKEAGYTLAELKNAGKTAIELKLAFTARDLREAGFSMRQLISAEFQLHKLRAAGFTPADLAAETPRVSLDSLRLGHARDEAWVVRFLGEAGYSYEEFRRERFSHASLIPAGFSAAKFKADGLSASDLRSLGFGLPELRDAGFTTSDLKMAGFGLRDFMQASSRDSAADLRRRGFTAAEVKSLGLPFIEMRDAGYSLEELKGVGFGPQRIFQQGKASMAELRALGFSAEELKAEFFDAKQLKAGGYSPAMMRRAGFDAWELGKSGFTVEEMLAAGYSVEELKGLQNATAEMRQAGVSLAELVEAGIAAKELRAAGFTLGELRVGGGAGAATRVPRSRVASSRPVARASRIKKHKGVHFSGADLFQAGFTLEDLRAGGIQAIELRRTCSVRQLAEAGYSLAELRRASFQFLELHKLGGFPLSAFKAAGFGLPDLVHSGVSVLQLKEMGFTLQEMLAKNVHRQAGVMEFKEAGFTAEQLKNAGLGLGVLRGPYAHVGFPFTLSELKQAGFVAADFKAAKIGSVGELIRVGFSGKELLDAGFNRLGLRAWGVSAREFREAGVELLEMIDELRFKAPALRSAGYSAKELRDAGIGLRELQRAEFSAREMLAAGFPAQLLQDAGYPKEQLKSTSPQAPLEPSGDFALSLTGTQILDLLASGGVLGSMSVDSSASRYERVKQNLASAMRGYVAKDISAFLNLFAQSFTQDLTIFRNAVNDDFVNDNDINVDLELTSYQLSQDTVGLSLIWNRSSTASNGGAPTVERGRSRLIFDRNDDFRVTAWLDSTPFGRRDQALRTQVQGGQVNDQTGISSPAPTAVTTPDPPVTVSGFGCSDCDNVLAVDIELGTSRKFTSFGIVPTVGDFQAGEDFLISLTVGAPPPLPRELVLMAAGGAIARCGGSPAPTSIGDIRNLVSTNIAAGSATFSTPNGSPEVFGLRTGTGKFVVLEVPADPGSTGTIRYQVHTETSFDASGTVDCP